MKLTLAILFLAASSLSAQVVVQAGKRLQMPAPGATTAVTLDPKVADASIENGILTIVGIGPGDTRVVAVSESGLEEVRVRVLPGPPAYPPGFIPPRYSGNSSGSYEFRFSSDRMQFENALDLYSQSSGRTRQLHVVSATFARGTRPSSYVPSVYYRVTTERFDATFLDQTVDNSSLTLQSAVLRGFHIKQGAWQFHGGYTASADFANIFFPTEKEFAAGLSYTQKLNKAVQVTPNVYLLRSIGLADGRQHSALLGSLLFNIHLFRGWELKSEVAYGRGIAFASELEHYGVATKFKARIMKKNLDYPSVRSNGLPGLSGDLSWTQILTARLQLLSGATINNVELRTVRQDSRSAYTSLRYKLSQSWSASTGANYGSFTSAGSYSAKTLALPQQVNFDRAHFGAGFQYQFSTASDSFSNGNGFRQTLRLNLGRFQIGEFADWQNDALSVNSLYSQLPGLQQELQRLGITAVTPDQISALLQDAAFLQSLGLSTQAQIITVPHRLQEGGNLTWNSTGAHPHQLSLSFIESHNKFAASSSSGYNLTGTYAKEISAGNLLQLSWSVAQSGFNSPRRQRPAASVSLRHTFSRVPEVFSAQKSTSIGGTVFIDAKRQGSYENGMERVPQAMVTLDGRRTAMTDSQGRFRFGGVNAGDHRIRLEYNSGRQHYFTTPQDTTVAGGSTINFGIAFSTIDLWGYVEDDAGHGLEKVKLQIIGISGKLMTATNTSGKFILPDVEPGNYQIQVDPESVPIGYSTVDLEPVQVIITANSAARPVVKIPAIRVLMGAVTVYDPAAGSYIPVKGAVVSIPELARSVTTNDLGKFTIGGLPFGEFEVRVVAGQSSFTHTINIPVQPVTLKDNFRISARNGEIAFTLAAAF